MELKPKSLILRRRRLKSIYKILNYLCYIIIAYTYDLVKLILPD